MGLLEWQPVPGLRYGAGRRGLLDADEDDAGLPLAEDAAPQALLAPTWLGPHGAGLPTDGAAVSAARREANRFAEMRDAYQAEAANLSGGLTLAQSQGFPAYWRTQTAMYKGLPVMVPRDEWAQYAPDLSSTAGGLKADTTGGQFTTITLHHTGSEGTPQEVEALHRGREPLWHQGARYVANLGGAQDYKFGDVGYHFMIGADGTIYEGRPLQYEGAHVAGHNPGNVGIAFLGNYANKPLSESQLSSAQSLIARLSDVYGIARRNANAADYIYTHGQFDSKRQSELGGAAGQIEALKRYVYGL